MRLLWNFFLYMRGWTIRGSFPYHLKKCVIIVGPHTSSWDFVIGLAFRSKLRLYHLKYLGKAELFKPPFGFFFRKLGGFPVDRFNKHNMVDQVVNFFNTHESFVLALSPEGTRKPVDRLRTGFYHIALKANVPIVMAGMDFKKREASFAVPFYLSGDINTDMQKITQHFACIEGKIPEYGLQHLLANPPVYKL
jgi:1-acyl-sn-glycerol-3-phosphate acyltransferase